MSLTAAQQEAITARGNVVVVAGAGTGKTHTLIERCLECLLRETPRTCLDEILIVTFTEAAAAELRLRLRAKLEEQTARNPGEVHWQEQMALFETAHIGTLHSFCFRLVREHFYQLELDPQVTVLAEEEARLLASETLDGLFQTMYAGSDNFAHAVQQLIQTQGRGRDETIRGLVLRLHDYTQTLPDPAAWFGRQLADLEAPEPVNWHLWLLEGVMDWRQLWAERLEQLAADGNAIAGQGWQALSSLPARPTRSQAATALGLILDAGESCPDGWKDLWLEPLKQFLQGAQFLFSLAQVPEPGTPTNTGGATDPLAEDWGWIRSHMITLVQLVQQFTEAFNQKKRELGGVDFHDLEQHALQLLWHNETNRPTPIAQSWRNRLRFIFVDEYQDINAAQDKIIEALSRPNGQANRFLVGDVKQSIYRFRLANPYIFQGYAEKWAKGEGSAIALVENFRSREGILDFVNALFSALMHRQLGGVEYDRGAELRFGARGERKALAASSEITRAPEDQETGDDLQKRRQAIALYSVELHLRIKRDSTNAEADLLDALAEFIELEEAAKEARLVGLRLGELKRQAYSVWDEAAQSFRPIDWRDMVVLLRAPANKSESYAKEFSRLNIPLQVARGGFYRSLEVSDLLSLLQILDNPLQDLPLLAVLHSPLVGLSVNELATVRIGAPKVSFWAALPKVQSPKSAIAEETRRKVSEFLECFGRWRRLARQVSLSRCLEAVLSETHYAEWLLNQARGEQRRANVKRLLDLAQEFDQFQRQGLFRFLRFIAAQQLNETEPEVPGLSEQNAVRLMSIHQSKGLEFPVVVVADLGKPFNLLELRGDVILDEKYGLCPQVKPPHTGSRYPSLPYWLARQRQTRELLGEELRLLYVATTRARDLLILSGAVTKAKFDGWRKEKSPSSPLPDTTETLKNREQTSSLSVGPKRESKALGDARSYTDWLGPWFLRQTDLGLPTAKQGRTALFAWFVDTDRDLAGLEDQSEGRSGATEMPKDLAPEVLQSLQQRLSWKYPFRAATRQPAKLSVSALRRRANAEENGGGVESQPRPRRVRRPMEHQAVRPSPEQHIENGELWTAAHPARASATEIGLANHSFLQLVSLDRVESITALKKESERLRESGRLSDVEADLVDLEGLAAFWGSDLGQRIRAERQYVKRELAFTARFASEDLTFCGQPLEPNVDQEFVIVRGAADLAVILPDQIWLVDFKTDAVRKGELPDKVKQYEPQLRLYSKALTGIYRRPVSECWLYFLALRRAIPIN